MIRAGGNSFFVLHDKSARLTGVYFPSLSLHTEPNPCSSSEEQGGQKALAKGKTCAVYIDALPGGATAYGALLWYFHMTPPALLFAWLPLPVVTEAAKGLLAPKEYRG